MKKKEIFIIAYGGILTGLVLASTLFFQIPNGQGGYINPGDGVIFASALILGPFAGISGGLGSALADIFSGYAVYAPATFVIKGLMGLVAGLMLRRSPERGYLYKGFVFLVCEVIMLGGYFLYETFLFGMTVAVPSFFPNLIQAAAGIALGLAAVPMVKKISESGKWVLVQKDGDEHENK